MKILLTSHGKFCVGLLESYQMIAGENEDISCVYLDEEGIGKFSADLKQRLDSLTKDDKVLVLTDIKGGTPYNESLKYKLNNPEKVAIVAGMNLPMLIETGLMLNSSEDLISLAKGCYNTGKNSIYLEEEEEDFEDELDL